MLLHVIANPRGAESRSKRVARAFLDGFRSTHPGEEVVELDLFSIDLPMVDAADVNTRFAQARGQTLHGEERARFERFARVLEPLLRADRVAITAPMWNFGMPWKLKQWLDVVTQARVTFEYTPAGPRGLLRATQGVLLGSRGGVYPDGDPRQTLDFFVPAVTASLRWLGVKDVSVVMADGLDADPAAAEDILRAAEEKARALGASL